jgi:chromosome partitioning protein
MSRTIELVRHYDKPFAAVLTFCPPSAREVEDTLKVIEQLGAEICPVRIGNRIAFSRAQQTGRAAQEIEPNGKAAQEIKALYSYVCMHLYEQTARSTHGNQRAASSSR